MSNDDTKRRRKRGERRDGRVLLTLVIGYQENGQPKRKYFYGQTRQEAEKKRLAYIRLQEYGITSDTETMTVNEWIDEWLRRYKQHVNPAYKSGFNVQVNRLRKDLGSRYVRGVVESDIQASVNALAGMSSSTIDKYLSVVHQVFSTAKRNKLRIDDPSEFVASPVGQSGSHRALEAWEVETILNHWMMHRAGIWVMLMLLAGLRRGEMIALDWKNVDLKHRMLHVHEAAVVYGNQTQVKDRTKTPAGMRSIPICQPLYEALSSVPPDLRFGCVCRSSSGKQLSESAFSRGWNGFCIAMQRILNGEDLNQQGRRTTLESRIETARLCGRKYIRFHMRSHDLRHTFATALYDAGVSAKAAQYYLGHADSRMTIDLYTHLSKEREMSERSQLTGFLDEWHIFNDGSEKDKNGLNS